MTLAEPSYYNSGGGYPAQCRPRKGGHDSAQSKGILTLLISAEGGLTVEMDAIVSLFSNLAVPVACLIATFYLWNTPFVLLSGDDASKIEFLKNAAKNESCAILCYDEEAELLSGGKLLPIGKKDDLAHQAKVLFTSLRDADKLGVKVIYGHLPPKDGLGLALYNRMIRAAAHTILKV